MISIIPRIHLLKMFTFGIIIFCIISNSSDAKKSGKFCNEKQVAKTKAVKEVHLESNLFSTEDEIEELARTGPKAEDLYTLDSAFFSYRIEEPSSDTNNHNSEHSRKKREVFQEVPDLTPFAHTRGGCCQTDFDVIQNFHFLKFIMSYFALKRGKYTLVIRRLRSVLTMTLMWLKKLCHLHQSYKH